MLGYVRDFRSYLHIEYIYKIAAQTLNLEFHAHPDVIPHWMLHNYHLIRSLMNVAVDPKDVQAPFQMAKVSVTLRCICS